MKKLLFLILMSILIFSCGQSKGDKSQEALNQNSAVSKDSLTVWELDFALDFINSYVDYCNDPENNMDIVEWVNSKKMVTIEFKKEFSRMVDEANEIDPERGLGFDPFFDAQDYPSEGFEVISLDPVSNLVYLRGKEWDEFELTLKAKYINGEWLVDGCGAVNVPEKDRGER